VWLVTWATCRPRKSPVSPVVMCDGSFEGRRFESCHSLWLCSSVGRARRLPTKNNWSRGGLAVAAANRDGYDRIIVITDGQWHFSDTTTVQGYGEGDPHTVAPAPLTKQAYMINVASYKNGVGYGKWTHIDGWSESVIEYIRALEQTKWVN
jgi:hypothetical protein